MLDRERSAPFANPVTFIFLDVSELGPARRFFECDIGFELIENGFHPPHDVHGLAKYDAGAAIFALNLAPPEMLRHGSGDGTCTVIAARHSASAYLNAEPEPGLWRDPDRHLYRLLPAGGAPPGLVELELHVTSLDESLDFYRNRCGADVEEPDAGIVVRTPNLGFRLLQRRDGADTRRGRYLIVLHTPDIDASCRWLAARGISPLARISRSAIGRTVRFADPTGHHFCFYEPAPATFAWGSGPTLVRIIEEGMRAGESPD